MFAMNLKKTVAVVVLGAAILVPASTYAGDVAGPGCLTERVSARRTDVYRMTFEGGRAAYVGIAGDRDTDLDLVIRDENGRNICNADGVTDRESCNWTPAWTGEYQIRVQNLGPVYNEYRLCTN